MEWYLKMWQQTCTHPNATITVVESITTAETTKLICPDCKKPFAAITEYY